MSYDSIYIENTGNFYRYFFCNIYLCCVGKNLTSIHWQVWKYVNTHSKCVSMRDIMWNAHAAGMSRGSRYEAYFEFLRQKKHSQRQQMSVLYPARCTGEKKWGKKMLKKRKKPSITWHITAAGVIADILKPEKSMRGLYKHMRGDFIKQLFLYTISQITTSNHLAWFPIFCDLFKESLSLFSTQTLLFYLNDSQDHSKCI